MKHDDALAEGTHGGDEGTPPPKRTRARSATTGSPAKRARRKGASDGDALGSESTLARARKAFAEHRWGDAYAAFDASDRQARLELHDLTNLAIAARLINREDESSELWIRVHHVALDAKDARHAIRAASWLALSLQARGETASAAGWLARSRRLLAQETEESVERGYHLMAVAMQSVRARDIPGAAEAFEHAARIGERFGDRDLLTRANQGLARTMIVMGDVAAGGELLDEVLVAVTASEVSSLAIGDVYCSAIEACYEMFDMRRAREWTAALTHWCESEPSLVLYRGTCQVRRAEVLQLTGAWPQALDQAALARDSMATPPPDRSIGGAYYRIAELRRLRGDFKGAAEAYREASDAGHAALPGLALLRLSEGADNVARAALMRALDETRDKRVRARLLAAFVEVLLRSAEVESADEAARELQIIATGFESTFLRATSNYATASVMIARGIERQALPLLRQSFDDWRELEAPYEEARTRVLIAQACLALGDTESAQLELDAAWRIFHRLGAATDLANAERLGAKGNDEVVETRDDHLTEREQEVLALLATGMTNRALAAELRIAEKTVARHVSNIFTKLGLTTRAAATAYALRRRN